MVQIGPICYEAGMGSAGISAAASPRLDQIINATRVLFSRYGYRRTAMDDIAREAGVAKATLYLHFSGKEDVFRAMVERCRDVVASRCEAAERLEGPVEARLAALLDAYFGTAIEWFGDAAHLKELRQLTSPEAVTEPSVSEQAFCQRLARLFEAASAAGEIDLDRAGLTAEQLAGVVVNAAMGAKYARPQTPESFHAEMRDLLALLTAAWAPAAAVKPLARRA